MKRYLLATLSLLLFASIALQAQDYEVYKGRELSRVVKSFGDAIEHDQLLPYQKTQGRRIKNEIEKYPDLPIDQGKVIFESKPGQFVANSSLKLEPSPPPDADFLGLDDSGGSIPPDVNGAPGPNHLMVTLNTEIRVMTRDGNPISTVSTGAFFHPTPGSGGVFDPKVVFDPFDERWIVLLPSSSDPTTTRLVVAVSATDDPTGDWYMYSFDGDPDNTHWFDYPNFGFSEDKLVVTGNLFGNGVYVAIYVFDKQQLYNNAPAIEYSRIKTFDGFTLVPAKTYDEGVEDIYMVHNAGSNGSMGYINLWKLTGPAADPTLENKGLIGVDQPWSNGSYANGGNFAPQLGSDELINTVDARMENMIYRNGKLWTTHHVYLPANNPTRCAVQWWNIDLEGELLQWGRVDDPTGEMYFAFATIAVNAMEDVLIGFGSFSENQYASASYAFRYADDPPNTMRDYYQYKDGLAPYFKTFGGARNRWGDYTATHVDPVDDLDFWTLQEFADLPSSQDHWGTWWAYLDLSSQPAADFDANIVSVPVGSGASFEDKSKFDPTEWLWTFEGGTPATSTEQNPQNIVYNNAGLFDVTLVATNELGSDTKVMEDFIDANTTQLPEVSFAVNDSLPCLAETITFTDQSVYNPNQWLWQFSPDLVTFANGTNATSKNPEVQFDYPLIYTVSLTATNNNGSSTMVKDYLVKPGGKALPFTEDFENLFIEAKGWTIENPDDDKTWEVTEAAGSGNGNRALYINLKSYIGFEERDRLISPPLNFWTHKEVALSFKYAYQQRMAGMTDSLIVSISEDCGESWARILVMAEDTAATRSFATVDPSSMNFIPETAEEWCGAADNPACVNLDLSAWAGKSNIYLMFESYNGYGNNIYIDDLMIDGTLSGVSEAGAMASQLQIYPNPASGVLNLRSASLVGMQQVKLYNHAGQLVLETEKNLSTVASLDVSELPAGFYLLQVGKQTSKVIVR